MFTQTSLCPRYSGFAPVYIPFRIRVFHSLRHAFPDISAMIYKLLNALTPIAFLHSVWPLSLSLATTYEISFDYSSCRYLDVSVHDVPFINLLAQLMMTYLPYAGFPHSDIYGSLTACVSP